MKPIFILVFLLSCKILIAQERSILSLKSEAELRVNPNSPAYDPEIGFSLYQEAALRGDSKSMNVLGILCSQGLGTPQDTTLAIQWFKKAAVAHYESAWYNLGQLYKEGIGVKQNFYTALEYYKKGSDVKSPSGYYGEGFMRYKGLGCEQNYNEAFRLFNLGVSTHSISSMYMLGLCYRNGYGTTANLDSARFYLGTAAAYKYQFAIDEVQNQEPENPDFKSRSDTRSRNLTTQSTGLIKSIKHHIPKDDIAGEYTGFIIRYDWSGQHVIGQSELKLKLIRTDSILTGIWKEDGIPPVSVAAKLTDSSLLFSNTVYERVDHYSQQKPAQFEFRNALLQVNKNADSVLLSGNIQLWSVGLKEPEKPVYISLSRDNPNGFGDGRMASAAKDSTIIGFLAYPNPFSNSFQVRYTALKETTALITLTDVLTGRQVYKQQTSLLSPGKHSNDIQVNLNPGPYILRLIYGKNVKATLVIKQ